MGWGNFDGYVSLVVWVTRWFSIYPEKMWMKKEPQVLFDSVLMDLYYQKDAFVYHIFYLVLADNSVSIWLENVSINTQRIREARPCMLSLAQALLHPVFLEMHEYFHCLMILGTCIHCKPRFLYANSLPMCRCSMHFVPWLCIKLHAGDHLYWKVSWFYLGHITFTFSERWCLKLVVVIRNIGPQV